jgi:hypothetical protein
MKVMTWNSSARMREEAPHANRTTRTATIINALKRRAESVLNDTSIDPQSRAVIRYALETNDPWLAKLVRYADESESNIEPIEFSQRTSSGEADSNEGKVEA